MKQSLFFLYLDRYHLEPMFVQILARSLTRAGTSESLPIPCAILHGSGERAERMLEANGIFTKRVNGVISTNSLEAQQVVERATIETNRKIVGILSESIVHAVGFQGYDRELLKTDSTGGVKTTDVNWVINLIRKGVTPVISLIARSPERGVIEVPADIATRVLVEAFGIEVSTVVFFTRTNRAGVIREGRRMEEISIGELKNGDEILDLDVARALSEAGIRVLLTSPAAFSGKNRPPGTFVVT